MLGQELVQQRRHVGMSHYAERVNQVTHCSELCLQNQPVASAALPSSICTVLPVVRFLTSA